VRRTPDSVIWALFGIVVYVGIELLAVLMGWKK
jgi:hypothetical protein